MSKPVQDRWYKGIEILLGKRCNNNCRHCSVLGPQEQAIDRNSVIKRLMIGKRDKDNSVLFSGGEPTAYNELLYFVRMAKSLGFENILISSNARLFTYKDYCKKLIQAGANIFFISIFSGKEKIHDSITRVKGSWKQTISGIRNLARLSDGLYVNISILKYNYKTMPALVVRLSKLGVKRINFNMLRPEGQAEMDYGILTSKLADLRPYLNKIVNYRLFKNIFFSFYLVPFCLLNEYPNADEIKNMVLPDLEKWDNFENGFKKYNVKIKTYQMLMKLRLCRSCKLCKDCPGVMKEYVRLFGKKSVSAELSPFVKKNG